MLSIAILVQQLAIAKRTKSIGGELIEIVELIIDNDELDG
jgi:hypothetical protein